MPIITIKNAPPEVLRSFEWREVLRQRVRDVCTGIKALGLGCRDVTVLFHTEITLHDGVPDFAYDPASPTIVEVGKLFEKRERSREVRQFLSDNLWDEVRGFLLRATGDVVGVEVFVTSFNPKRDVYSISGTPLFDMVERAAGTLRRRVIERDVLALSKEE